MAAINMARSRATRRDRERATAEMIRNNPSLTPRPGVPIVARPAAAPAPRRPAAKPAPQSAKPTKE